MSLAVQELEPLDRQAEARRILSTDSPFARSSLIGARLEDFGTERQLILNGIHDLDRIIDPEVVSESGGEMVYQEKLRRADVADRAVLDKYPEVLESELPLPENLVSVYSICPPPSLCRLTI
jgi:hypothetical protein